jgi:hypothetical protein
MKRRTYFVLLVSFMAVVAAQAEDFQVEHDHFRGSCRGKLVFSDTSIEYVTETKKHAYAWKYEDIQQLEIAPNRISILTYDRRKMRLGADRRISFKVISGALSDPFRQEIEKKLARPLVSSIVPEPTNIRFSISARHRLFLSGTQGVLEFGENSMIYRSNQSSDSHIWHYKDLLSIGSTGPFQLRIGALQKTGGEYGEEKNYVFDLKRQMTSSEYDFIWGKINRK